MKILLYVLLAFGVFCFFSWNRTHKAAVSKQVKIKRNLFEMSGFSLFCQIPETQRSAEY